MLSFWLICALLIIVALVIVLPSLLAKDAEADVDRDQINRAVYDKKLLELAADYERDLIDQEQLQIAKADLQRTLIDDAERVKDRNLKVRNKAIPIIVTLTLPILTLIIYLQISNGLHSLDPEFQSEIQALQEGEMPSVDEAITSLEQKLKQDPSNLEGWIMLGRSYLITEKFKESVHAYTKANDLSNGANPDILVAYGEAQAYAAEQKFEKSTLSLFIKALKIDPRHERGLWYAGMASYQLGDFDAAIEHWENLMQQIPSNQTEVQSSLLVYVNDARKKAGLEATQVEQIAKQESESSGAKITVNVSLAENLRDKIVNSDTLFIYARAENGPKMPLALVKKTAGDLPATVTLDDSVSMMSGMTLSTMDRVEVIARISKSGQAIMQSGDIFGTVTSVSTKQAETVDIEISELAP